MTEIKKVDKISVGRWALEDTVPVIASVVTHVRNALGQVIPVISGDEEGEVAHRRDMLKFVVDEFKVAHLLQRYVLEKSICSMYFPEGHPEIEWGVNTAEGLYLYRFTGGKGYMYLSVEYKDRMGEDSVVLMKHIPCLWKHVMGYGLVLVSPTLHSVITLPGPGLQSYLDKGYTFYRSMSMEQAGNFILSGEYHSADKDALVGIAHLYLKAALKQVTKGNTSTLPASLPFLFSEQPLIPTVDYAHTSELGVPLQLLNAQHVEELRFWSKITERSDDLESIRFEVSGGLYTNKETLYTVAEASPTHFNRIQEEEWPYRKLEDLVADIHNRFYETMQEILRYRQVEDTDTVSLLQYLEFMDLYIHIIHTYTNNFKG